MNTGIIKPDNDHRSGGRVGGREINQRAQATEKFEHIKASARREGWQL